MYDITYMIRNEEQIWVWTSSLDEDKGVLFDVFSPDGEYLDSFYIPNEISFMHVQGDILFARKQDEEGIYSVVKYRILNGLGRTQIGITSPYLFDPSFSNSK